MSYQCELLDRQRQPALVVRTRAAVQDLPQVLGSAWGAIMQQAGKLAVQPSGPPYVAYHNMDMQDLELEIGFPFPRQIEGEGEVTQGEIPGGKAAACLHVGPYDQLRGAYEALGAWMKANGHVASGPAYEFYLNDPRTTPPAQLQTQVVFPLS
jgi:effector-binding domain-containing protein